MTENGKIESYKKNSMPYGKPFGEWTIYWWRWALETPLSANAVVDRSGRNSGTRQPANVWFLAGKFVDGTRDLPCRTCKIPRGRAILFPVINCEANSLEYPELKTEQRLIEHVKQDIDSIVIKECYINGQSVTPQRQRSVPLTFDIDIHKNNGLGVKGGKTVASSDGYWVFLKPLPEGDHVLSFTGMCGLGTRYSGANYKLTVD